MEDLVGIDYFSLKMNDNYEPYPNKIPYVTNSGGCVKKDPSEVSKLG
jgi:hypothetical protein